MQVTEDVIIIDHENDLPEPCGDGGCSLAGMPPRPFIRGRGNVIPRLARTAAVPPKGTRVRFNPAGSMAKPG